MSDQHCIVMTFKTTSEEARKAAENVLGHLKEVKTDRHTKFSYETGCWLEDGLPWQFRVERSFIKAEASGWTKVDQGPDGVTVTVDFNHMNDTMRLVGWKPAINDTVGAYTHFLGEPTQVVATPSPE